MPSNLSNLALSLLQLHYTFSSRRLSNNNPKYTDILGENSMIAYEIFPGIQLFLKFCADKAEGSQGKSGTSGGL